MALIVPLQRECAETFADPFSFVANWDGDDDVGLRHLSTPMTILIGRAAPTIWLDHGAADAINQNDPAGFRVSQADVSNFDARIIAGDRSRLPTRKFGNLGLTN